MENDEPDRDSILLAAQNGDLKALQRLTARIESYWPNKSDTYFDKMEELLVTVASAASIPPPNYELFQKNAASLIAKDETMPQTTSQAGLRAKAAIVRLIVNRAEPSGKVDSEILKQIRLKNADLIADALGYIRDQSIPDYKPARVVMNIAPPPGVPGVAGMAPSAIADSEKRAIYEKAIQENAENSRRNSRQAYLRRSERKLEMGVEDYFTFILSQYPDQRSTISALLARAKFSKEKQNEILKEQFSR